MEGIKALNMISRIADNNLRIYQIEHSDEYSLRDEAGDDTLWYEIEAMLDDNATMKAVLENHGYNPDSGVIESLSEMMEIHGCITHQEILASTKLENLDRRCYVKYSTVVDGMVKNHIVWIYLDSSYDDNERMIQDIVNTCWGIAEFFGQCFKEILEYRIEA